MTNYAMTEQRSAPLHSDFAREFLARKLSPVVVTALYAAMPTYSRGPRKGLVKGYLHWTKCSKGGWVRDGVRHEGMDRAAGYVMSPGTHKLRVCLNNDPLSSAVLEVGYYSGDEQYVRAIETAVAQLTKKRWG